MGTVTKALELLDLFTRLRPALGLSELARLAGVNKATCHRLLTEMQGFGLVEQIGHTREYRLGPAVLRLAALREATVPQRDAAMPVVQDLATRTGETAHLSLIVAGRLVTIGYAYSTAHATRVMMDDADVLPYHATSSGHAVLAYLPDTRIDDILSAPLPALTSQTLTDPNAIRAVLETVRRIGHAETHGTFEREVHSMAVPLFDASGACTGALGVVCPASRLTPDLHHKAVAALTEAASRIIILWGGRLPPDLDTLWRDAA